MKYKAVLLDMDGTVLDTLEDLTDAVNAAMKEFGLPPVEAKRVRAGLGNGAARLIRYCVPEDCGEALCERVLAWYKPYYDAHCRIKTRPYPGILPMMKRLKARGIRLAVISNKPDPAVKELAEAFFPGLLDFAVGESGTVRRKPDPDAVLAAAARFGVDRECCVYVGDSEVDVMTAKNAAMDCVAVGWGFRDIDWLKACGAEKIARSAEELERLITA